MSTALERMKARAVNLARLGYHRKDTLETLGHAYDTGRHFWNDPELKAAAEIARRYEADTGQKVKAYAAGWPQLVNWNTCGADSASNNTFTTIINIGPTQQPNIPANSTNPAGSSSAPSDGTLFKIEAFGIIGSAAGTATTTLGLNANGGARAAAGSGTAIAISASQTPATSTVLTWQYYHHLSVISVGGAGTIQGSGHAIGINATASTVVLIPATQAAAATWVSTQANYFNLVATWNTSAAGNLYQVNGFAVLQYN